MSGGDDPGGATVCPIRNIGPRGRRQRAVTGVVVVFATLLGVVLLLRGDVPLWYRLAPLPFFWFGCLGIFQALHGT